MVIKPYYKESLQEISCHPTETTLSAEVLLNAIQNADEKTKQALRDELAKCNCQDTKDIFGDDPTQLEKET